MPKVSNKCKGYEVFQRLNYLFQIKDVMCKHPTISSHYGNLILNIAKKSVLKMDPGLKRQICKRCKGALVPGQTLQVKTKRKDNKPTVAYKCNSCKYIKEYPLSGKKKLWTESKEAVVGVIDCEKMAPSNGAVKGTSEVNKLDDNEKQTKKKKIVEIITEHSAKNSQVAGNT